MTERRGQAYLSAVAALLFVSVIVTSGWVTGALPIAGMAAPLFSGGHSNATFWGLALGGCVGWVMYHPLQQVPMVVPKSHAVTTFDQHLVRGVVATTWKVPSMLTTLCLILIGGHALLAGVVQRTQTLSLIYEGRHDDERARYYIYREWLVLNGDNISVNSTKLEAEISNFSAAKKIKNRIQRWIHKGCYQKQGNAINVTPYAFREYEPSGLGKAIRLANQSSPD